MSEPRGHADMYGALLVETDLPEADMAALFLHNEGRYCRVNKNGRYLPFLFLL